MFTPKYSGSRSGFSPFGATPGSGKQSRRRSGLFTPQRSTRSQRRVSSLQTSLVGDDVTHRLDSVGLPLPIQVTEALTLSDRSHESTAALGQDGWAWLVCDRRLFVWRYKAFHQGRTAQCRELTLPPSSRLCSAALVAVLSSADGPVSCVAAVPEGVVRYWPNIVQESLFTECSLELKDDLCKKLIPLKANHCILGTANSAMHLLNKAQNGASLVTRPLRGGQGMLSGISRRMSSLLFGAGPTQQVAGPLHQLTEGGVEEGVSTFFALSGGALQKWSLIGDSEKLVYQVPIESWMKDCAAESIWGQEAAQLPHLKTWLLDMHYNKESVLILGACVNPDVSPEVSFVLASVQCSGTEPPESFLYFTVTKYTTLYQDGDESQVVGYHLLMPNPRWPSAYIYNTHSVLCVPTGGATQPIDRVDFQGSGDQLLGAGVSDGTALFFSFTHGLVSIKPTKGDVSIQESITEDVGRGSFAEGSFVDNSRLEELSMSEDTGTRLKAAFLHFCKNNMTQMQVIVDEVFPAYDDVADHTSPLDKATVTMSQELIDDFPASDPRWAESVPDVAGGSSASLIIQHQLEDKLKAHGYLINFLKASGLLDRLCKVPVRSSMMSTKWHLCEHAEKLAAAIALRGIHAQHAALIDGCIQMVLEQRGERVKSGLTPQDMFYREVSKVDELLLMLTEMETEAATGGATATEASRIIAEVNTIVTCMLREACQYRQNKRTMYISPSQRDEVEFIPWTASLGPQGCRELLKNQHTITLEAALPQAQDAHSRGALYQQLVELTDLVLDGYNAQLDSLRRLAGGEEHYKEVLNQYEQDRNLLITPFVEHEQFERAAALGEKYCDFTTLIRICEVTNNQERLNRYMSQFQSKGFADHVFRYYTEEGKRGKLMSMSLAKNPRLGSFLQAGENKFMSWLHDINANNYTKAHKTLLELGEEETKSVAKKKTLLSLSKLAALAGDDQGREVKQNVEDINDLHDLTLHQEQLPSDVLESLALDPDNMRVMSPKELVELFVSEYNKDATEFDVKKALDLLHYVQKYEPQADVQALKLHVWCRAILRDSWDTLEGDDPLVAARDTIFFKTVELAYTEGISLREFLPDINQLLAADELGALKNNKHFQFLIKAGYEHLQRITS